MVPCDRRRGWFLPAAIGRKSARRGGLPENQRGEGRAFSARKSELVFLVFLVTGRVRIGANNELVFSSAPPP